MAEWLVEDGIGERRAALVERGRPVELAVEWDDDGIRAGTIARARLTRRADATGRGLVALTDGTIAQLAAVPGGLAEGGALTIEIVREALVEPGTRKPPSARALPGDPPARDGPDLRARLGASGTPVRTVDARSGALDASGWGEALEEASSGVVAAPDVLLRIALTPAMTVIDVDGAGAAPALAIAGARAAAAAIRRFAIAGSIGIDLPTLGSRADRHAAAAAFDAVLPQPFERTAVNGFGFLQVVRRRERPSLMERLAADPAGAAARALLRAGERAQGHGPLTLAAQPPVIARLAARPDWLDALARRRGLAVGLREEPGLAISAGHAFHAFA